MSLVARGIVGIGDRLARGRELSNNRSEKVRAPLSGAAEPTFHPKVGGVECALGRRQLQSATLPPLRSGDLVPLSDFGSQGAAIHYKAWVCTNPSCGFILKIRNGGIYVNEPINNGQMVPVRARFSNRAEV